MDVHLRTTFLKCLPSGVPVAALPQAGPAVSGSPGNGSEQYSQRGLSSRMPSLTTDQPSSRTAAGWGLGGPLRAVCARLRLPCAHLWGRRRSPAEPSCVLGGAARPSPQVCGERSPAEPSGVWGARPGRALTCVGAQPDRALRCVGGAAWASPQRGGRVPHLPGWEGAARPCPQVGAALASPQVRAARGGGGAAPDGGPGRAGPLCGRLLAGAGLRRGGAGGAAGGRVRRRVLLRPAHLRGRHRHLPQPGLVGVLVRGQPGGAARRAAGRRGAAGAQGPRGHAAAADGERPQRPPHGRARPRPPRRAGAGAAARPGPPRPPRRARQVRESGTGQRDRGERLRTLTSVRAQESCPARDSV